MTLKERHREMPRPSGCDFHASKSQQNLSVLDVAVVFVEVVVVVVVVGVRTAVGVNCSEPIFRPIVEQEWQKG